MDQLVPAQQIFVPCFAERSFTGVHESTRDASSISTHILLDPADHVVGEKHF